MFKKFGESPRTAGGRLGFVYALATTDPPNRALQRHISDVVVAPEAEGHGVRQRLLAAAEACALTRGCGSVT